MEKELITTECDLRNAIGFDCSEHLSVEDEFQVFKKNTHWINDNGEEIHIDNEIQSVVSQELGEFPEEEFNNLKQENEAYYDELLGIGSLPKL